MQRQNDRELRDELVKLRAEHRQLDDEILDLEVSGSVDQLLIRRLKKKKLALKDQITKIEDQLLPDIIA
ncbi:YdcH family protein [Hyphomicrobium sp.]|uniref:YdcH family protein n=1 Tax=Hyphomicrobium sp. TaxID=82 RepID=UPI002FE02283